MNPLVALWSEFKMWIIAIVVAIIAFVGFMSLVGSPSEVETIIGLIIAAVVFIATFIIAWRVKSHSHEEDQNEKIAALEREIAALKSEK
jgi:Co/Zn/Cd efflux system component